MRSPFTVNGDIIMNYAETLNYLKEAEKNGIIPGLDSIKRLCGRLSDPQNELRIIHIAGTNGKGSVGTFINSILTEAGYTTGRYVSPAVMDFLEIIQYRNRNISETEFAEVMTKVKSAADSIAEDGFPYPTVFELETAAAFCFFAEKKCDFVLLEAGMGGKSDATNLTEKSELSVITSISLEHTQFLGDTLEKIAAEKGGIIKENGNLVTITQSPEVTDTLMKICAEKSAELTIAKIYNISDYSFSGYVQTFSYRDFKNLRISLIGKFQTENAALAVEACCILRKKGFTISDKNIYSGLENARWPGRFEVIRDSSPVIIIDGAHNSSAAARLRETIDICFAERKITYIMGTFKDKNFSDIAKQTARRAKKIYTVSTEGKRKLEAEKLADAVRPFNGNVTAAASVEDAVSECMKDGCDIVIAFGSLSFLRKIKDYVNGEAVK